MANKHTALREVTRNADEIQTTFIGFLLDGRVIEIGDINHKPNREHTRLIVAAVNYHHRLREALDKLSEVVDAGPEYKVSMAKERIAAVEQARALLAELDNLEHRGHE